MEELKVFEELILLLLYSVIGGCAYSRSSDYHIKALKFFS